MASPVGAADKTEGAPLRSGIFVLANTILGAGMLGLPAAFAGCGMVAGSLLILLFGGASILGLHLLSEAADIVGRPATFHKVAEAAMPGFGVLFDAAIAIKCFGVATSYLIVVGDNMIPSMVALGVPTHSVLRDRRLWVGISAALAAPLAFLRQISRLRFTAALSLSCVVMIIVIVLCFAVPSSSSELDPCADVPAGKTCRGPVVAFTDFASTVRELPIFVFAYTCHQNIPSVTNEMARPTSGRALLAITCAIGTGTLAYFLLAVPGYATFGALVQDDVLKSYPTDSKLVAVARIGISLIVTLCYPLQAHPTRMCVTSIYLTLAAHAERLCGRRQRRGLLLGGLDAPLAHEPSSALTTQVQADLGGTPQEQHEEAALDDHGHSVGASSGRATHVVITTAFILASTAIALKVTDLGVVLEIVGATGSTTVSYILPGACYYIVSKSARGVFHRRRGLALAMLVSGLVIMPLSLTLIVLKQMGK